MKLCHYLSAGYQKEGNIMISEPYKVSLGHDDKYYPEGPGNGFSFYSGTPFPEFRFDSEKQAEIAAAIANRAYEEGYAKAQEDIRKTLGINK